MGAVDRQLHLVPGSNQTFGDAGADPVATPVDHHHRTADPYFIAQHLPGVHHLQFTAALEGWPVRLGAGGDNHHVRFFLLHQCPVDSGIAHHAHAGQFHFPLQVGAGTAEFAAPWQQLREQHLTAQLRTGFVQRHLMAALGRDGGGFHPGRATAGDHDAFALWRLSAFAEDQLAPGFRVLDAGNRQALVEVADARLIAGNARPHVFDAAGVGLVGHLRIADQRPGHAAHIGLAASQNQLGFLGLVDAPGDEQRNVQTGLERAGFFSQISRFDRHGRHDVHRAAERRRSAGDDVHVIELRLQ
ncbi:hypothetical protein D3C87_1145470 [compost metagenome]